MYNVVNLLIWNLWKNKQYEEVVNQENWREKNLTNIVKKNYNKTEAFICPEIHQNS